MAMFQTTRWSQVLATRADDAEGRVALESLCRAYRPPVLAYIGSRVQPREAAEDLTQAFFTQFLETRTHALADPLRGRFRTLLLTALHNFLVDAHARRSAQKRGGDRMHCDIDDPALQGLEDNAGETPEHTFDRVWAMTMIDRAVERMRREATRAGKGALFERLREFLLEVPDESRYDQVAAELEMRPNTLAVTVHRMRARLRDALRAELMQTVGSDAAYRDELADLRSVLSGL